MDNPTNLFDPSEPWRRRPNEPTRAYAAFVLYRNQGPHKRSLRLLSTQLKRRRSGSVQATTTHINGCVARWSRDWDWVARVEEWDDHMDRQALLAQIETTKAMNARHAESALRLQAEALAALERLDPSTLQPRDIIKMFSDAVRVERMARSADDLPRWEEQRRERLAGDNGPSEFDSGLGLAQREELRAASREFMLKVEALRNAGGGKCHGV